MAANFWEKISAWLDWLGKGYLIVEILGGLGGGTMVKALLKTYTDLPSVWVTPIWLLMAAVFVALLVILGNKKLHRSERQRVAAQNTPSILVTSPPSFDATEFLRIAYNSSLQSEIENGVRAAAPQNDPTARESYFVRIISVGSIAYLYDIIWAYIYRSQIFLLMDLNRRILPLYEVKTYYTRAANENAVVYAHYSFEQWMSFLRNYVLTIQLPGDTLGITIRGKDFLKYLTHFGRYADDKRS